MDSRLFMEIGVVNTTFQAVDATPYERWINEGTFDSSHAVLQRLVSVKDGDSNKVVNQSVTVADTLEKLKNVFFEEEYVEVDDTEEVAKKVEPKKVEKKVEKVDTEEIKNKTRVSEEVEKEIEEINEVIPEVVEEEEEEPIISDRELVTKSSKIEYFNDSLYKSVFFIS